MLEVLAFIAGIMLGSFLNVCIRRVPLRQSIVSPGSRCPRCGAAIHAYDNIPIVSFFVLRGRCRKCRQPISARYPLVELLTGLAMVVLVRHFGLVPELTAYVIFVAALIVITFIDLDHQIIPDVITLPGIVIGVLCAAVGLGPSLSASLIGLLFGGGFLYAVAAAYEMLARREGMGGGDIKLLAMIGAFLGWQGVLTTLLIASLSGALVGGLLIALRRLGSRSPMPFGPFLAAGAGTALLVGTRLLDWYVDRVFL
jgi:leader peptidase (prepilin peptidase)/N-methyltransferase